MELYHCPPLLTLNVVVIYACTLKTRCSHKNGEQSQSPMLTQSGDGLLYSSLTYISRALADIALDLLPINASVDVEECKDVPLW